MGAFVRHIPCPKCGSSDGNALYEDGSTHCFVCRAHKGGDPLRRFSAKQEVKQARAADSRETSALAPEAREWLSQYELTDDELALFKWNPVKQHLIYREGSFYNARNFSGDGPKYISYGAKPYSVRGHGNRLILVEDIISALVVARSSQSLCLFGSNVQSAILNDRWRVAGKPKIGIWLDRDKWGEAVKLGFAARAIGIESFVIESELDPKSYSDGEVSFFLNTAIQ